MVQTLQAYESVNQCGLISERKKIKYSNPMERDVFLRKLDEKKNNIEVKISASQCFLIVWFAVNLKWRYH